MTRTPYDIDAVAKLLAIAHPGEEMAATQHEWAVAYLRQAMVDLAASRADVHESVRAMLLQMAFEKIAKAALLKNGQWTIEQAQKTHVGASHMMMLLCNQGQRENLSVTTGQLRYAIKPLVDELEGLHAVRARTHREALSTVRLIVGPGPSQTTASTRALA